MSRYLLPATGYPLGILRAAGRGQPAAPPPKVAAR